VAKKQIAVIGGGIAGCAAAHYLVRAGYEVTIFEQNDYLGGRMHTVPVRGLNIDTGASFMTDIYTNMLAFLREAGVEQELQPRKSRVRIMRNGKAIDISPSVLLGGRWLSFGAKARLLREGAALASAWRNLDLHNYPRALKYDLLTVAERYGSQSAKELLRYGIEPLLNGYFYWSSDHTSNAVCMLHLKWWLTQKQTFIMPGGLGGVAAAAAEGSRVMLHTTVESINRQSDKIIINYRYGSIKRAFKADAVVCAVPAPLVTKILSGLNARQKKFFTPIQYSSTVVASYCIAQSRPRIAPHAITYPEGESKYLNALTYMSELSDRAVLVKLYAKGDVGAELCGRNDAEIHKLLSGEAPIPLESAFRTGNYLIQRWPAAIPMFDVGHFQRLKDFADGIIESKDMPLVFAGDYIGGPFMEGAFTSGMQAADRLQKILGG
jgi:oxygen-dependent protoporphyrinogen oxidase